MNMKRIVFITAGILIMMIILFWVLHSMAHIDEINQRRREKNQGEEVASRMIQTTATTSIWDAIRPTETETMFPEETEESGGEIPTETVPGEEQEPASAFPEDTFAEPDTPIPQTMTETAAGIPVQ